MPPAPPGDPSSSPISSSASPPSSPPRPRVTDLREFTARGRVWIVGHAAADVEAGRAQAELHFVPADGPAGAAPRRLRLTEPVALERLTVRQLASLLALAS